MQANGLRKIKGMNGYFLDLDSSFAYVRNVVGALPGNDNSGEMIIISAHYDHLGSVNEKNENPKSSQTFNGANDDASGVAVMLSLAAYFAARPVQRTIVFIAFSGEEIGFIGSTGASEAFIPTQIVAQINLEMLGRTGLYKKPFVTGHNYSDLRDLLNQVLRDTLGVNNYFEKDTPASTLFQRSDNYPFALLGVPAHTIMLTTDADEYYHTVDDDPNTLDYKRMASIAKKIAFAIEPLVQGKITPQRIAPGKIPHRLMPFNIKGNFLKKSKPS
jgi:Zn-dependent M28 family amino/carboxypeptidase